MDLFFLLVTPYFAFTFSRQVRESLPTIQNKTVDFIVLVTWEDFGLSDECRVLTSCVVDTDVVYFISIRQVY